MLLNARNISNAYVLTAKKRAGLVFLQIKVFGEELAPVIRLESANPRLHQIGFNIVVNRDRRDIPGQNIFRLLIILAAFGHIAGFRGADL